MAHKERHSIAHVGWLRAAVLGANDGLVSTASLVVGVAAAATNTSEVLLAGTAGLAAGALSMAAGEYVSVSSQRDAETADLAREKTELMTQPDFELIELTNIYVERGLERPLARQVAEQLMAQDALKTHAREELGISELTTAKPLQAAAVSAITFAAGAFLPILAVVLAPSAHMSITVITTSLIFLGVLGGIGAYVGGAPLPKAISRVTFWGALAMLVTAGVGSIFGAIS